MYRLGLGSSVRCIDEQLVGLSYSMHGAGVWGSLLKNGRSLSDLSTYSGLDFWANLSMSRVRCRDKCDILEENKKLSGKNQYVQRTLSGKNRPGMVVTEEPVCPENIVR
jgi:hypothetical protein